MNESDDQLRHLLDDLGRALAEAIAASTDVTSVAARLRQQGYSLNLILNCTQSNAGASEADPLVPAPILRGTPQFETSSRQDSGGEGLRGDRGDRASSGHPPGSGLHQVGRPAGRQHPPAFRLNAHDVDFLKALGIDGTRPGRRPRGSR